MTVSSTGTVCPCENYSSFKLDFANKDRTITIYNGENETVLGRITTSLTTVTVDISNVNYVKIVSSTGSPVCSFTFLS